MPRRRFRLLPSRSSSNGVATSDDLEKWEWTTTTTTDRAAYSPAEFAAAFGKSPTWAYRLLYSGKIKAITNLGRLLIPASEMHRLLETTTRYDPKPKKRK